MKKMDIRTKFTKKALKNSLIELMKTAFIRDIPIKAICTGTGVSRSTFYTYYDDQYNLLEDIQNEIFDNFAAGYTKHLAEPVRREGSNDYEEALRYIADNHDSIQVVLSENSNIDFQKKLVEQRIMDMKKMMKPILDKSTDEKIERLYSVFIINGCLALLQDWLKHGTDIPIHKMAKLCSKIFNDISR
jgi:AcrR family transcriptional regulator